jgi:hypothetical protein
MAKILAASLNCQNGGPTVSPCGKCESCLSIQNATSLDVVEMDAASNNSVDDVRELRERVAFAPVGGGYKVYILDEAHMLTPQAWNAFLKTLEEPPPHTIFVLATTEANKVLPTVVDRCHRFDFARPTVEQLAQRLQGIDGDLLATQGQVRLLRDEIEAVEAQRTNQNLYILSIVTALLLPATLVTGIFGMNTGGLPFAEGPHGTLHATLIAAGTALATYLWLRSRGFMRR